MVSYKDVQIGQVYSDWTVQSLPFKKIKRREYYVTAVCKCGTQVDVRTHRLLHGITKNCKSCNAKRLGNLSRGTSPCNTKTLEEVAITRLYKDYKRQAKKRNLSFSLSKELFSSLIQGNCIYCNKEPSNVCTVSHGIFKYNGIDRWNNNIGYAAKNSVTSCKTCNFMKKAMSGEEFTEHIFSIMHKNSLSNIDLKPDKLDYYYNRVLAVAAASHDKQTKVGAILISRESGAVVAEGFNGFIRGAPDDALPNTRPEKYDYIVHAEMNLLFNAVRHGIRTDNGIIFVSTSPCISCMRGLWQAGIRTVYCKNLYSDFDKNKNMKDLQINVTQVKDYYKLEFKPKSKK